MKVDAIIFDKDGTLIDFDAFWVALSTKAIEDILKKINVGIKTTDVLQAFGVKDGVTDVNSVLCKGTYEEMGEIFHNILSENGCGLSKKEVVDLVIEEYNKNVDSGIVKPTSPKLEQTLRSLKEKGKKLVVVTTDNEYITLNCLKKLGIEELFDKIYTDDGVNPAKPHPFCANDFCQRYGLDKNCVVMVGDTMTDVKFARNAGIKVVSLINKEENIQKIGPYTDFVVDDLSKLLEVLE